jgi:hypothetical protein
MHEKAFALILVAGIIAIAAAANASGGGGPVNSYYSYDPQGRLVNVTTNGTVGSNTVNTVTNYTLDNADNRTNQNTTVH